MSIEIKSIGKENISPIVEIYPTHYAKTEAEVIAVKKTVREFTKFMSKPTPPNADNTLPKILYQFTEEGEEKFTDFETDISIAMHYIVDAEIDIRLKMFRESNMIENPPMQPIPISKEEPIGKIEKFVKTLKKESKIENKPDSQMQPLYLSLIDARQRWYNICSQYADACRTRTDDYYGYVKVRDFIVVSFKKYVSPILLWCMKYSITNELGKSRRENKEILTSHLEEKARLDKIFTPFPQQM